MTAFLVSTIISIIWGKYFIEYMRKKQFGQIIRNDGPESHFKKAGTPTMGGIVILVAIFLSLALTGNFHSWPLNFSCIITISYFVLGYCDDYLKVLKKDTKGISASMKLVWQFATSAIILGVAIHFKIIDTFLYLPFYKGPIVDLGNFYILFGSIVIVGSSNAVNLTDGLDGLAIGPIITSASTFGILAYAGGHVEISKYLYIPYIENIGELTVMAAAIVGAGVGFLWFNSFPAQIFMGDVGSLSIGGGLGAFAVLTKNEFLFVFIGGVFVIEALSVILQVLSYKFRKKRIFKMAPIHHHFELSGWPEPKVIVRFWIISLFLAIFSIATLKIR